MTKVAAHTALAMAEHWTERASRFEAAASHIRDADQWHEMFRTALGEGQGQAIDLGCGTGACALILADLGYRVTAVDGSSGMLAYAREAAKGRNLDINFIEATMDAAPLDENAADVVVMRNVLWTLENPQAAVGKAYTLLREGGRIVISDGIWRGDANDSEKEFGHHLPSFNGISEPEARDWLARAGFMDMKSWQHLFATHPYGTMYDRAHANTQIEFFVTTGRK